MKGVPVTILDAQTVDETLSTVLAPGQGIKNHTFILIANASVAGVGITGALALESADLPGSEGGWAPLGGNPLDLSTIIVPAGQLQGRISINFSNIILNALRGRISTVVAGGTLTLVYVGQ